MECLLPSEYDKKVPLDRRVAAYNVRTLVMNCLPGENGEVLKKKGKIYKDQIIQICDNRNDNLGEIVRARALSTLSDLHAADAKYHNHFHIKIFSIKGISHHNAGSSNEERDQAFFYIVNQMIENKTKSWSSIELFSMYKELGGASCTQTGLDAAALVWTLKWPVCGKPKVGDIVEAMNNTISDMLKECDVYCVFDCYVELSTKSYTCKLRLDKSTKVFKFSIKSPLPAKSVVLKSTKNKMQLYSLFKENLTNPDTAPNTMLHKLIVTGQELTPVEMYQGEVTERHDMATSHKEADVVVVQQAMNAILHHNNDEVKVISDDTDVFALLVYLHAKNELDAPMYMESPKKNTKNCVDIKASALASSNSMNLEYLLQVHAISGCDTVSSLNGIGKPTALKVAKTNRFLLTALGSIDASTSDVVAQGTRFISACYGQEASEMTKCRQKVWQK